MASLFYYIVGLLFIVASMAEPTHQSGLLFDHHGHRPHYGPPHYAPHPPHHNHHHHWGPWPHHHHHHAPVFHWNHHRNLVPWL
ncbi:uncharacterized protein isoform X1 [Rhodnius prolixus]|uniref:uncharacterized protein isoform X1 n=1 Tax=Rhodnius prolixus TaxID=13249 RepID=UPI003D18981D